MNNTLTEMANVPHSRIPGTSITSQLILTSLFPMGFFGLLAILGTTSAINNIAEALVMERNAAIVQFAANSFANPTLDELTKVISVTDIQKMNSLSLLLLNELQGFEKQSLPNGLAGISLCKFYLVDKSGMVFPSAAPGSNFNDLVRQIAPGRLSHSYLVHSPVTGNSILVSYAQIKATGLRLIMAQPWEPNDYLWMNYDLILAGLLVLGIVLTLIMLSVSIKRIIQPVKELAQSAELLGPGSVFRPLKEQGAEEVRRLLEAFNGMVIRLAEQQSAMYRYAEKALLSQEEERQRISHELHDETVQDLIGLVQRIELCRRDLDQNPTAAQRRLDELKSLAESALTDLRRISNALRPSILEDLGLPEALQALCDDLMKEFPEITSNCHIIGERCRLPFDMELAIFRVVQEALTNIRRHAVGAESVTVTMSLDAEKVIVTIKDDGSGFQAPDTRTLMRMGHYGLAGMAERARFIGGDLNIQSIPGLETIITLSIPVPSEIS